MSLPLEQEIADALAVAIYAANDEHRRKQEYPALSGETGERLAALLAPVLQRALARAITETVARKWMELSKLPGADTHDPVKAFVAALRDGQP